MASPCRCLPWKTRFAFLQVLDVQKINSALPCFAHWLPLPVREGTEVRGRALAMRWLRGALRCGHVARVAPHHREECHREGGNAPVKVAMPQPSLPKGDYLRVAQR